MIVASNIISHRTRGIYDSMKTKEKRSTMIFSINSFSSAIIEHTNQVIFMEDDDLAVVHNGALTIHRTQHGEVSGQSVIREIHELKIELQQIMKGKLN